MEENQKFASTIQNPGRNSIGTRPPNRIAPCTGAALHFKDGLLLFEALRTVRAFL